MPKGMNSSDTATVRAEEAKKEDADVFFEFHENSDNLSEEEEEKILLERRRHASIFGRRRSISLNNPEEEDGSSDGHGLDSRVSSDIFGSEYQGLCEDVRLRHRKSDLSVARPPSVIIHGQGPNLCRDQPQPVPRASKPPPVASEAAQSNLVRRNSSGYSSGGGPTTTRSVRTHSSIPVAAVRRGSVIGVQAGGITGQSSLPQRTFVGCWEGIRVAGVNPSCPPTPKGCHLPICPTTFASLVLREHPYTKDSPWVNLPIHYPPV